MYTQDSSPFASAWANRAGPDDRPPLREHQRISHAATCRRLQLGRIPQLLGRAMGLAVPRLGLL